MDFVISVLLGTKLLVDYSFILLEYYLESEVVNASVEFTERSTAGRKQFPASEIKKTTRLGQYEIRLVDRRRICLLDCSTIKHTNGRGQR